MFGQPWFAFRVGHVVIVIGSILSRHILLKHLVDFGWTETDSCAVRARSWQF